MSETDTIETSGSPHVDAPSVKAYGWILGALLILLLLTAGAHLLPLGPFGLIVSMGIAVAKALLVAVFFMHLKYEGAMIRMFAGAGLFWLAIMVALTLGDYFTRF